MMLYYYRVDYSDSLSYKRKQESGLVSATNYGDATHKVVDYYGELNITSLYVEEWNNLVTEDDVLQGFATSDIKE